MQSIIPASNCQRLVYRNVHLRATLCLTKLKIVFHRFVGLNVCTVPSMETWDRVEKKLSIQTFCYFRAVPQVGGPKRLDGGRSAVVVLCGHCAIQYSVVVECVSACGLKYL